MLVEQINRHLIKYKNNLHAGTQLAVVVPIESARKKTAQSTTMQEQQIQVDQAQKNYIICGVKLPHDVHQALAKRVREGRAKNIKQSILDLVTKYLIDSGDLQR